MAGLLIILGELQGPPALADCEECLDLLAFVHQRLAVTALYYFFIISLWGYFRFFRRQGIDSAFWGMLALAEILVLAQVVLGGAIWLQGLRPAQGWLHLLYGAVMPVLFPAVYFYTRGQSGRPEILVYSTAAIITCGLILRAIYTGEVPF